MELTLEQKFNLKSFETQVNKMSETQAKEFLVKLYAQQMIREELYKGFIRQGWGISA